MYHFPYTLVYTYNIFNNGSRSFSFVLILLIKKCTFLREVLLINNFKKNIFLYLTLKWTDCNCDISELIMLKFNYIYFRIFATELRSKLLTCI